MKVLIFFMESAFQKQVHGGSAVILKHLSDALVDSGDEITILCRYRRNNTQEFKLNSKTTVKPILKFKEVFPDAYFTPPYNIASAIAKISDYIERHDVFINFDSNFIFQDIIKSRVPIINCLHHFVYSGALQGTFLFRRDTMVANSVYTKAVIMSTVGRFFTDLEKRIIVINNGIDAAHFKKVKPRKIFKYIPRKVAGKRLLLCPHRPEDGKGIFEAIQVLDLLCNKYKRKNYLLLIPIGLDVKVSTEIKEFYKKVEKFIKSYKLNDSVLFHEWIPFSLMNEYYSLGRVTLCIGNQIESFGNIPLESILCGTPPIISRIGAYRYVLPEWAVIKTNYGDLEDVALKILGTKDNSDLKDSIDYIDNNYSLENMSERYVSLIHSRKLNPPLKYHPRRSNLFTIPPWCYVSKKGLYNDYERNYRKAKKLEKLFINQPGGFSYRDALYFGLSKNEVDYEVESGYVVPYLE